MPMPRELRFWSKVRKSDGCWEWQAARFQHSGYGMFNDGKRPRPAHRVAWELCLGPIPRGLLVRHKCDNRPCVRPDHLELGTHEDNTRDMIERARSNPRRGAEHPRAKLTAAQVDTIRLLVAAGVPQVWFARAYGVAKSTVAAICKAERWYAKGQAPRCRQTRVTAPNFDRPLRPRESKTLALAAAVAHDYRTTDLTLWQLRAKHKISYARLTRLLHLGGVRPEEW